EPAFAGVKADLHLAWRVARVHVGPTHDLVVVGPVDEWANATAIGRAFACAASRRGRILCVGTSPAWREAVAAERTGWDGLERRAASRTLERAVGVAAARSRGNDTRAFTDAVIELLPQSRTDVEHFDEVWR